MAVSYTVSRLGMVALLSRSVLGRLLKSVSMKPGLISLNWHRNTVKLERHVSRGTTLRNVRVSDDLWGAALRRAEEDQTTVSEALRTLLQAWVDGNIELS
jgi:hypothetical protein